MSLLSLLQKKLCENSVLGIDEYMSLALCHPQYGYYMRRDPFGVKGDFTTAPEISQIFGELLGAWIAHQWMEQGCPRAILAELGPGRGTLMSDALRATRNVPGFHENISVHLVEVSPALRAIQKEKLGVSIHWHEDISTLPVAPLFFIANEFFDALPIKQWVGDIERKIVLDAENKLCFTLPPDNVRETCEAGEKVMHSLCAHIRQHGGAGLVIDYGYEHGKGDTLQAMKNHAYHNVLETPGEADITAHVNFGHLKKIAENTGLKTVLQEQGRFLLEQGATLRAQKLSEKANAEQRLAIVKALDRLTSPDAMGSLFKVLMVQK